MTFWKFAALLLLLLCAPHASAACQLRALQGELHIQGADGHVTRTLQYRTTCDAPTSVRMSVNADADGTVLLHGNAGELKASVYLDNQSSAQPLEFDVGPDGRVVEVRIDIHGGGFLHARDEYIWRVETHIDY